MSAELTKRQQRLIKARSVLSQAENDYGLQSDFNRNSYTTMPRYPKDSSVILSPQELCQAVESAMGDAGWAVIVGQLHVGWAAWVDYGIDLSRILYVPNSDLDFSWIVDVAIGAVDIVVCDSSQLSTLQWKRLLAKARARGSRLVSYNLSDFWFARNSSQEIVVAS